MMKKISAFFRKPGIPNPPWDYDFICSLDEKEYPKYLAKIFKLNTGEDIDLTPPKYGHCERNEVKRSNSALLTPFTLRVLPPKRGQKGLKTFNKKIQWLKLYDVTPLKKLCTDKVTVRDYVKEKIGEEYLKPVLQIITKDKFYISSYPSPLEGEGARRAGEGLKDTPENRKTASARTEKIILEENSDKKLNECRYINTDTAVLPLPLNPSLSEKRPKGSFSSAEPSRGGGNMELKVFNYPIECESLYDKIDFDSLPESFVMKCSHGCKWQYIIKDKEAFLKNKGFFEQARRQMTGWLEQEYWAFGGFEMQYKGLEPKIIIEPLMRDNINEICPEIFVFCFSGMPKFILYQRNETEHTPYDEHLNITEDLISSKSRKLNIEADENVKLAFELSKELSEPFIFVRVDFMLYQNKLYFEELTFTPYSGFLKFKNQDVNIKLGNLCNLDKKEDFMNKIDELDEESINELYDKSVNFIYNARSKPCSTVLWNQALYGADK